MAEQAINDEQAEIKKRAMRRLVVAATLVIAAVLALAVLSRKPSPPSVQAPPPSPRVLATLEPLPPPTEPEKPAEPQAEKPAEPQQVEPPPAAPSEPPPPPPQVVNPHAQPATTAAKPRTETQPTKSVEAPRSGESTPRETTQAIKQTTEGIPSSKTTPAPQGKVPTKPSTAPVIVTPEAKPSPASKPAPGSASKTATANPAEPPPKTIPESAPAKGYTVQLGLFSNTENALQLQKRLAEHGIKSYTETRLNVGPFRSKEEADQTVAKIRAMGINAVLVPTR